MESYIDDVLFQPASLKGSAESLCEADSKATLEAMCSKSYKKVVFSGMGSSNYCSWGAGILLSRHGICNIRLSAGELLHYEDGLLDEDTLLILISQSGESAEICRLIEKIPANCTVATITNDPNSTLAKRGQYNFILNVAEEAAVTTRTYLASLMVVNLIAFSIAGYRFEDFFKQLAKVVEEMDCVLKKHIEIADDMAKFLGCPPYLCVLGRGYSLSTVEAGTLFLREVVKYPAMGLDSGEFRHGPMEMVDETFSGILIAPDGDTFELQSKLAFDITEKGGKVIFIASSAPKFQNKNLKTILLPYVEEWLSPILTIIPIQLYADCLAKVRGVVPGVFRWGSKITKSE